MKKSFFISLIILCAFCLKLSAQQPEKFDPKKFEAQLEQFITTEAGFSPQEVSIFFPLYREMKKQQRVCFIQNRRFRHVDLKDGNQCRDVILKQDENAIKIKEIQAFYHKRILEKLPADKVFLAIKAENKFHRKAFKHSFGRR